MAAEAKKIGNSKAEITLTTEWTKIEKSYNELLNKYQKQLTLPGFRKGKAPLNVVETKIGNEVLTDASFNAMNDTMTESFKDIEPSLRPLPYVQPEIVDSEKLIPFKKGNDITFTVRYEIMPEVKLESYKGLDVEYPNVIISEEMVDTEIERYREQNAEIKTKEDEIVENGDLVTIDYTNLDLDTDNKKVEDYTFTVGKNQNYYKFDEDIIGMKNGETKNIVKKYTEDNKPEGFTRDTLNLSVTVKSVKSKILPEVNDDFAQDIKSEYKTVEDLKNGIKKSLTENLDHRMRETKIHLIAKEIIERNEKFEIPQSMIDFEVNNSFNRFAQQMGMDSKKLEQFLKNQGQSKEQFTASWRPDAENNLREQLIISKVGELENVKAEEEKVAAAIKSQIPEGTDEERKKSYEGIIRDNLDWEATIDYLINENNLKPGKKEITYEDFASGKYLEDEKTKDDAKASEEN